MKKALSFMLSLLMCISCFCLSAGAEASDATGEGVGEAQSEGSVKIISERVVLSGSEERNFAFVVPSSGTYNLRLIYAVSPEADGDLSFQMKLDGNSVLEDTTRIELNKYYKDNGAIRKDGSGSEFAPEQVVASDSIDILFSDDSRFYSEPVAFELNAGEHSIAFSDIETEFTLECLEFIPLKAVKSYKDTAAAYSAYQSYGGAEIHVEGEAAILKSAADLAAKADNSNSNVFPSDAFYQKLNYIGGNNWSEIGDTLVWKVEIPESGLYNISFFYRQNYILNGNAYRELKIDNEIPFAEAAALSFPYASGWKRTTFSSKEHESYAVYLTEGEHTFSLKVTLGPVSEFCDGLETAVYDLGKLYREIVMVTGETPDNNRDYNLFGQIPDFEGRLKQAAADLKELSAMYESFTGDRGGSTVSIIGSMVNTIESMLKYKHKAQSYKSSFYSNYSSVSASLYDMMKMPLDIDTIVFSAPDKKIEKGSDGFFKQFFYSAKRFIASFTVDYNNISGVDADSEKLTLWINWGRDQAQVLNFLIQSKFTEQTGLPVNVKITNASLVQGILSGNMPDCALQQVRSEPVNLALRNALYDMSKFADYEEVIKRFSANAVTPYVYQGGTYGLPDTQSFLMMFIRTDIFEEMSLEVPKTWEEFTDTVKILSNNNLETAVAGIFNTLLLQSGGNLYNEALNATALSSTESIAAFEMYTDFFTKYDCPKTFNFYNRFRTGLMPMGIQDYSMYATLKATAPEIDGNWKMYPIPGMTGENGDTINISGGTGTACVILKGTGNEENAWEFLKWWTDAETQAEYTSSLEAILGISGRVATSNIEAASRLEWDGNLENLLAQWSNVGEFNEVPGSYYVSRVIDQAYWNVVNNRQNPRDMIYQWSKVADKEIEKKISQYQ